MKNILLAAVAALAANSAAANAAAIMPNFAGAPTGWTLDRYAP